MYSSNIGAARMAMDVGAQRQRDFLARMGLLKPPTIEISELATPHYPAKWREVNVMTIAFGHGISVTPIGFATAGAALVNGGVLHQATLLKLPPGYAPQGKQVISAKTSERMRKLLRLVVEHGTGTMAAAPGYVVGGKTGTADKVPGQALCRAQAAFELSRRFPDERSEVSDIHDGRRAAPEQADARLCHRGLDRGAGDEPHRPRIAPLLGVQPIDENSPDVQRALVVESLQGKRIEAY